MDSDVKYLVEWFYKDGKSWSTLHDTLELAERQSSQLAKIDDIRFVCVSRQEPIEGNSLKSGDAINE